MLNSNKIERDRVELLQCRFEVSVARKEQRGEESARLTVMKDLKRRENEVSVLIRRRV